MYLLMDYQYLASILVSHLFVKPGKLHRGTPFASVYIPQGRKRGSVTSKRGWTITPVPAMIMVKQLSSLVAQGFVPSKWVTKRLGLYDKEVDELEG